MIALLASSLLAAAFSGPIATDGHLDAAAFEFVKPGVTRAEVDRRLGKPWVSSPSVVIAGTIDLFVDEVPVDGGGGPRKPQPTEDVHYYEYRPDAHPSEFARIVFKAKGTVWYAMLPPRPDEKTLEEAKTRYGPDFVTRTIQKKAGHLVWVLTIHRLPEIGVGFLEEARRGLTHRLVFPPEPKGMSSSPAAGTARSRAASGAASGSGPGTAPGSPPPRPGIGPATSPR